MRPDRATKSVPGDAVATTTPPARRPAAHLALALLASGQGACLSAPPPSSVSDDAAGGADGGGPDVPGLVAHWPLDSLEGGVAAERIAGRVGRCVVCPAVEADGRIGGALSFDGDEFLDVMDDPVFVLHEGTIAAWIQLAEPPPSTVILGKPYGTAAANAWAMGTSSCGGVLLEVGGAYTNGNCGSLSAGVWHHVAVTWGGDSYVAYADGVGDVFDLAPPMFDDNDVRIGADRDYRGEAYGFVGLVDDVQLYGRALASGEIEALAGGGPGGGTPAAP